MFTQDFFPTPTDIIELMLDGEKIENKTILEPSAGKGNIVDYLLIHGAKSVLACENNQDLKKILITKCPVIAEDFLTLESHQISHIDLIVMNPPFSRDEKHILHAFNVAPAGCKIVALCNLNTVENKYSRIRKELGTIVENFGTWQNLGECFKNAERKTEVEIALVKIQKPGENYSSEFEGFFLEEEIEEQEEGGIISYNFIRDLVNRYVGAMKVFDEQLAAAVRMNNLTDGFYRSSLAFHCTEEGKPKQRNDFKKDLQKEAWQFVFAKMNMQKYATQGLKDDINKFVEQQTNIPFTMRNVYRMLEIVIGTQEQRMDKALLEVFDKLTQHYDENRYNVEGWKTNSHYLINQKFIMPHVVESDYSSHPRTTYYGWAEPIEDMQKALCYLTGMDYNNCTTLNDFLHRMKCMWNTWYSWGFFEIKCFKKGTMHFKFQTEELWGKFNQRIAKLKGYPLFEATKQSTEQTAKKFQQEKVKPNILFTAKVA